MGEKRSFNARFPSFAMRGIVIGAIMAFMIALPQISYGAISEEQPANIPQAIKDDWKANGVTDGHQKRVERIKPFINQIRKVVFGRHYDLGGSIIGYVEEIDESYTSGLNGSFNLPPQGKGSSYPRSGNGSTAVMITEFTTDYYPTPKVLYQNSQGVIKDPAVNYEATKVAFAMSKDGQGMHIYEIGIDGAGEPKQLTDDDVPSVKVSDFEPCYLPTGDIMFNSSRCLGQVDCNFGITSNLYMMSGEGKYTRRIGYDQVHTFFPSVMDDGTVMYSRWEYNDRNVSTAFGVFTMYVDGSHQTELFGNQLEWPNTFPQPRQCPGAKPGNLKFISTIGGHQGKYCDADLVIVDPKVARNDAKAVQRIAPKRANPSGGGFSFGGPPDADKKFQTPYPLSEEWFLISYREKMGSQFKVYLMNLDGDRELIGWDPNGSVSCSSPFPATPREKPTTMKIQADYAKSKAECTMTNAYYGIKMNNVQTGSIAKIRVLALDYRIAPWFGNAGAMPFQCTPVARFGGSWESKRIVGEMEVESDGSADFWVPPRTPIYFQLIDKNGCCIQSMRSWSTLMPGEKFACYGCHEDKNETPPPVTNPKASTPKDLKPFYNMGGVVDGKQRETYMHFPEYIQPILDDQCVSCHKSGGSGSKLILSGDKLWAGDLSDADNKNAFKYWSKSYWNLSTSSYVNYISYVDVASAKTPNSYGSCKSGVISKIKNKPSGMASATISDEARDKIAAWIDLCIPFAGKYNNDMRPQDSTKYEARVQRRRDLDDAEKIRIEQFVAAGQPYGSQTISVPYGKNAMRDAAVGGSFTAHFSPIGNQLFIKAPCEGTIALSDVLGRQILTSTISKNEFTGELGIALQKKLPKGIYVVKFIGGAIKENRVINVL